MVHQSRNRRYLAEGGGLGGTQVRDRVEKLEEARLAAKRAQPRGGSGPIADPRLKGGSPLAHVGTQGAPDIYREKEGGRKGGKGKRI